MCSHRHLSSWPEDLSPGSGPSSPQTFQPRDLQYPLADELAKVTAELEDCHAQHAPSLAGARHWLGRTSLIRPPMLQFYRKKTTRGALGPPPTTTHSRPKVARRVRGKQQSIPATERMNTRNSPCPRADVVLRLLWLKRQPGRRPVLEAWPAGRWPHWTQGLLRTAPLAHQLASSLPLQGTTGSRGLVQEGGDTGLLPGP